MPFHDSGWTMVGLFDHLFGPERVFEVVTRVEDAQQMTERVVRAPGDAALRRALRQQLRELRETADAHRWVQEGDVLAALADFPVTPNDVELSAQQVRQGLRVVHGLVRNRLARAIALQGVVTA